MGTLRKFEITHDGRPYTVRVLGWDEDGGATVEVWVGHRWTYDDFNDYHAPDACLGCAGWDGERMSDLPNWEGLRSAGRFWAKVKRGLPR